MFYFSMLLVHSGIVGVLNLQVDSVVPGTNGLLISNFGSSTQGERHNSYYANHPKRTAHLVMFKISVGRDPKNPTTCFDGRELNCLPPWSNLNFNWLFFKILKFSGPSLPGMTSSTPSSISCLGFIMTNSDCHILCTQA